MRKIFYLLLILSVLFCGCGKNNSTETKPVITAKPIKTDFAQEDSDMFTNRDAQTEYDAENSIHILLDGNTIACSSDKVKISGTSAEITDGSTYIISGSLENGSIIINCGKSDKPHIILNNVNILSESYAALYIKKADKVFITLEENTQNTLKNGGVFEQADDNNVDAAVFSKSDITFNGAGILNIESLGGHGIVSKDDIVFIGGEYNVTSSSCGIKANDSIRISDSHITVKSGKDGIHAENSDDTALGFVYISKGKFNITSEGDGISAGELLQIQDGEFEIFAGGGSENSDKQRPGSWDYPGAGRPGNWGDSGNWEDSGNWGGGPGGRPPRQQSSYAADSENTASTKAIKAAGNILINNGTFEINSADDSVHSNASITINGGKFEIKSGDDGFHADEALSVTSGNINIKECYEGLEALNIEISGGEISLISQDDGINAAGGNNVNGEGGGSFEGGPFGKKGFGNPSASNGSITISGGNIYIQASGDGIDANGSLMITGGFITICGPTTGDTATLDFDTTGTITGGTFIGTGSSHMAQSFSSAKQGVIMLKTKTVSAGTQIILKDADGNEIISHTPELSYDVIILSSPEIKDGQTYQLLIGSNSQNVKASSPK